MKIPQIFLPEHEDLERKTEELLNKGLEPVYTTIVVENLLQSCEKFIGLQNGIDFLDKYKIGEDLAGKIAYTKLDIEELCKRITAPDNQYMFLGFYISALVNKIITANDHIILMPKIEMSGLGTCLPTGKVTIDWDTLSYTGYCQKGGDLIVEGSASGFAAAYMTGGTFQAKRLGDCACYFLEKGKVTANEIKGVETGCGMKKKGELYVKKAGFKISPGCKGRVYLKNRLIWPRT